jgi:nitrogen-specific signal transduction histidine kinase
MKEGQVHNVHGQFQSKNLGTFSVDQNGRWQETGLNQIIEKVQNVVPLLLQSNGAIAVNVTLSKKDLKILADSALMVDALLGLVGSALYAMPDGGTLTLSAALVNFRYQYILDGSTCRYGACASITVAGTSRGVDAWWPRGKSLQPILTRKTDRGKNIELSTAHGIIKQHHGSMKIERASGEGTSITVYLPLVRLNDTSDGMHLKLPEGPYTVRDHP